MGLLRVAFWSVAAFTAYSLWRLTRTEEISIKKYPSYREPRSDYGYYTNYYYDDYGIDYDQYNVIDEKKKKKKRKKKKQVKTGASTTRALPATTASTTRALPTASASTTRALPTASASKTRALPTASASTTRDSKPKKQVTGPKRCFGQYRCEDCRKTWMSSHCWPEEYQKCKTCNIPVLAYKTRPLEKPDGLDKSNEYSPHREDLCGMCKKLGRNCAETYYSYYGRGQNRAYY